ncbi:MAG: leucyl/phenylalanyl-tRNA--protein transferase [Candidatus Berkiella sp.]
MRLLSAYRMGIFPWYDKEPILWWSPDPRTVIFLDSLHISKSLQKTLHKNLFTIKTDENFAAVLKGCARDEGTWLNQNMQAAYLVLHQQGYAHSIEVYENNQLVGGLYGVVLGRIFYGESMFSLKPNASKVALVALVKQLRRWGFSLIDCQVASAHLMSMGATLIPRQQFLELLRINSKFEDKIPNWHLDPS